MRYDYWWFVKFSLRSNDVTVWTVFDVIIDAILSNFYQGINYIDAYPLQKKLIH